MGTRATPRRAFWLSHLHKWQAQGGTMKAYAQANDLSVDSFYAAKSAYAGAPTKSTTKPTAAAPSATFLPVRLAPRETGEAIRVSLPNGVRIEVPGRLDAEQWRALLGALGSRA